MARSPPSITSRRRQAMPWLRWIVAAVAAAALTVPVALAAHGGDGTVTAKLETEALFDDDEGGNADADDPAIWVAPGDTGRSLVIGTKKNAGMDVYDLAGQTLQRISPPPSANPDDAPGRFNNVDVLYRIGGRDLAVTTD